MELTHFGSQGRARMVDVSDKGESRRTAVARGEIHMSEETLALVKAGRMKKGDVLAVAQVAGIQGAKHCWEMIPMCHQIPLTGIDLSFRYGEGLIEIEARVTSTYVTGVEMEALCAVSTAALTIYDMCKAVQKNMVIDRIRLISKTGGKSGDIHNED